MKYNVKLRLFFIAVALAVLCMFVSVQATEASSSVGFVVDFSETMKETIGSESKIDIAREILDGILDNMKEPLDIVLTMYGHRDENRCDDIELIVFQKGKDRTNIKDILLKAEPKGKAPIAQALDMTAERLMEIGNSKNIVMLITDGKMTCEGDLRKTAREIRERYDYSIILHVVGLDLKKQDHPALSGLREEDVNIVFNNRVANLKKIYPYIPESLNRVLMHFSKGANWFYENTTQLLDDLREFKTMN